MAKVNLLPRKEFEIITDKGETVKGKFGTWAMKRFCQKKNVTLTEAGQLFISSFGIDETLEFILSAVEQSFREQKSKESFPYNDIDCGMWIDELGGLGSEDVVKLLNHAGDEQKKTVPVNPSNGMS